MTAASAASTTSAAIPVDLLVVGGGIQGLLVLRRAAADGLSCALVTPCDLGTGQTLHSHGILNTGFGMVGPEPVRLLHDVVLPDLERMGVRPHGEWAAPASRRWTRRSTRRTGAATPARHTAPRRSARSGGPARWHV